MVAHPPQPEPPLGHLTWSYVIDLTKGDPREHLDRVWPLASPWWRGHVITIQVGDTNPLEHDPRIRYCLLEARRQGLRIHIEGDVGGVSAWWRALQPPPEPARHLQAVR